MALIKCIECGKEFSNRASACPNCACPTEIKKETKTKKQEEKEIISIKLDKKKLKIFRILFLIFGILSILLAFASLQGAIDGESGLIFPTLLFGFFGISFLSRAYLYIKYDKNQLVLTNKRLKGEINFIFSTVFINIPIERIDGIVVEEDFLSTGISIMSNKLEKNVYFILNAEEFVDKTIKEIEKYKNR